MACCLYFSQGSRTWLALVPISAVFARLSSGNGAVIFPITFIFLSTILLLTLSKTKPITPANPLLKEAPSSQNEQTTLLQNACAECSCDDAVEASPEPEKAAVAAGNSKRGEMLMAAQDFYSESESMDQCSSTSSEDHYSSDVEWPYDMRQRLECSDGSISDEESLIEIAIPSGQFVSPDRDLRWNSAVKCCRLSEDEEESMDLWAEMNEEDNLIEIDINIGSIKC